MKHILPRNCEGTEQLRLISVVERTEIMSLVPYVVEQTSRGERVI